MHRASPTLQALATARPTGAWAPIMAAITALLALTLLALTLLTLVAPPALAAPPASTSGLPHAEGSPSPTATGGGTASASPTPAATAAPTPAPTSASTPESPATASPASPSTASSTRLPALPLRVGARGARVVLAQQRLQWLGYEISAGNLTRESFGESTKQAVRRFQSKNWLPATGRIDKRTWNRLSRMAEPVGILPRRCTEVTMSICIDKTARVLRWVVKGKVRMTTDARFGAPGMETGEGLFTIHEKSYNHVSSRYDSWMPRAMFFNGDEAVHYSPDFASVGYARGSHGCVGIRDMEKATQMFMEVPVGTRVYVYWS